VRDVGEKYADPLSQHRPQRTFHGAGAPGAATGDTMTPNDTARTTVGPAPTFLPAAPAQRLMRQRAADQAVDLSALAQVLRLDRSTLYRVLSRDRLRYDTADRIAVCLGRHPSELWPEWFLTHEENDR